MKKAEAYKVETFSSTTKSEIQRLQSQVELFWSKEFAIYKQLGLENEMKVLECGCGPGFLIEKIASEFPGGQYTGLEIDPMLLGVFQDRIQNKNIQNIEAVNGSILETGLPDSTYDIVITRLVVEHLSEPNKALVEIGRVLKDGGRIIVISNDFDYHLKTHPDIPELDDLYDAYCRARSAEGGNPKIGRELASRLAQVGYVDIFNEMICAHSTVTGDDLFLKSEGVGISAQLVKDGFLNGKVLDRIIEKWRAVLKYDGHAFVRPLFIASGRKSISIAEISDKKSTSAYSSQEADETIKMSIDLQAEDMEEQLHEYLIVSIASAMNVEKHVIADADNLDDLGFDSLAAVTIQDQLELDFGLHISISSIFQDLTIKGICSLLVSELKKTDRDSTREEGSTKADGAGASTSWEEGEI